MFLFIILSCISVVCASDNNEINFDGNQNITMEVGNDNINSNTNINTIHSKSIENNQKEKIQQEHKKNKNIKKEETYNDLCLNVYSHNIKYGDSTNIYGRLKNNNTYLTQKEIILFLNDNEYTTTTNENGFYNFTISEYNIGTNEAIVMYDDEINFISNTTSFNVRKLNTIISINNAIGRVHENIIECAIVTDETDYVVNEGYVTFLIQDQIIGTAEVINGIATLDFVYNTSINSTIFAIYGGSDIYNPSSCSRIIQITKQYTIIITSPISCIFKEEISIEARIIDEFGDNVTSGKCILKINGQTMKDSNGKMLYSNVNNGVISFNITVPFTQMGLHNYTIVYAGNSAYNASRATNDLLLNKRNYTININVTPNSTKRGCTVNLTATIDSSNITINWGKVIFKVNGITIKDENGTPIMIHVINNKAELFYTIPESLSIGEKTIKAVYLHESSDRIEIDTTLTIAKQDIYLILEEINYYSNKLIIKANIFNEFNQTINRNITYAIKLNGVTQLVSVTNYSTINIQINNTYNANNYTLSIVIGENTGYNAFIYTENISLCNPKISIENYAIYRCENNNITMVIPEEYVNPNNNLLLYLDDLLVLNTTITNQNMTTEYYIPIFYEGNHTLHAIITNETNQNMTQTNKNINILSHYIYVNSNGNTNSNGDTINNPTTLLKAMTIANDTQIILLSTLSDNDTYPMNKIILYSESNPYKLNIMGQNNKTIIFDGNNTNYCMSISSLCDVTFSNVKFINGYNNLVGGLFINNGNLTIINSTIEDNHAVISGGAIINNGNLTLLDNIISNNSVLNDTYYYGEQNSLSSNGGAIFSCTGNIILINNTLNNNSCYYGGVISANNSSISLINNTFSNNKAKHEGGALYFHESIDMQFNNLFINNTAITGSVQESINSLEFAYNNIYVQNNGTKYGVYHLTNSTITIDNCSFEDNNAGYASSIYSSNSNLSINNSLFNNNTALIQGGSIISLDSLIIINNSELNNNKVINNIGGGLYSERSISFIANTIFNNNSAKYGGAIYIIGEDENNIENSQFTSNNALVDGGAIYSSKALLYLNNNTFLSNNAQNNGGAISTIMSRTLEITNSTFINNNANNYTNIHTKETVTSITNNSFDSNIPKTSVLCDEITGNINDNYWGNNTPEFNIVTNNNTPQSWKIIENGEYITLNNTNITEIETAKKIISLTNNNTNQVNTLMPKQDINIISNDILTTPDTNITINITFSEKVTATIQIILPEETFILQYLNNTNQTSITYKTDIYEGLKQIHVNLIGNPEYMTKSKLINIFVQENLSHFNLNDYQMITSVKDQGLSNACWAFASIATLESTILKTYNQTKDFSENHLKNIINKYNINGTDTEANTGSSLLRPINYMVSWTDPVNDADDIFYEESTLSSNISSTFHVQDVVFINQYDGLNPEYIKEALLKYGALFTDMNSEGCCDLNLKLIEDNYYFNNTINYYSPNFTNPDHAITIIGWDDNYSKYNFNNSGNIPEGDGAFIIKNSWGTDNGLNGFNYVSYYDKSIGSSGLITFNLENQCNYSKIYQHETCSVSSINTNHTEANILNSYKSENNEQIQAVGTFFDKESNYTVTIYKNNIEQYTQEGNIDTAGYHTIKLKQYVPLNEGDNFSVMIRIQNENVKIFVQDALKISSENITDESFFLLNETKWINLKNYHLTACIKVYTGTDNQTNTNTNITHSKVDILTPHNEPSQIPNCVNENYINISNSVYIIKIPITYNITSNNAMINISTTRIIRIAISEESFDFVTEDIDNTYISFDGIFLDNPQNKEEEGIYISKNYDNTFINIELVYEFTDDINFFSTIFYSFTNHPGQLVKIADLIVNDNQLCKIMFYPSINYTVGVEPPSHEDFITIFSYNNQSIKRVGHINYLNNIYPEIIQTYLITKTKMNSTEFLTSTNEYLNYTTNILNAVYYLNDLFADIIAEAMNVSCQRESYTTLFCGYNGSTCISALDTTMGINIEGNNDDKLMFRLITSYMLPFWEENALNSSANVDSAIRKIFNAIETNSYNIFEDENYIYLVLNDETNTTLTMDKNTGVIIDYVQYGENVIHGVQSDDDYTWTGLKVGSEKAEFQRVVGSILMSVAPYCIGIPVVGPELVVISYATGFLLCADACGLTNPNNWGDYDKWIDLGWDVATSLPVEHIIGFISDSKKIVNIFKHSEQIEQSAKTVESTFKTTTKSVTNYIKTKTIELAEKTSNFVREEVTQISKVTETVVKDFLKILHLPVPKTVYDDFSKGLNELFKLDVEKLSEHSTLNKANYEIFCSKLNREKSKTMGFLYAYYGFSKETVENIYTHYSEKVYLNITLTIGNKIIEWLKEKYNECLTENRQKIIIVDTFEDYYVAYEEHYIRRYNYEVL